MSGRSTPTDSEKAKARELTNAIEGNSAVYRELCQALADARAEAFRAGAEAAVRNLVTIFAEGSDEWAMDFDDNDNRGFFQTKEEANEALEELVRFTVAAIEGKP